MTPAVLGLFPGLSPEEGTRYRGAHRSARKRRSGTHFRRTALEAEALTAAVAAAIRHNYTRYDQLLVRRSSRSDARDAVRDVIDQLMDSWRSPIPRLQHYFAKSGHKDLFYHPTPYLKRVATTAPFGSREASAAPAAAYRPVNSQLSWPGFSFAQSFSRAQ